MWQALRDLHQEPEHWQLSDYSAHAWRLARTVWLAMLALCIVLGAVLPPHNPAKMFEEYRPYTIYTVIVLLICGVVAVQCARLTAGGARVAWSLAAGGFLFLAIDDLVQVHERLDKLINRAFGWDPKATLPDLLDTAIVGAYGLAGLVALYVCRRQFFGLIGFARGIVAAGAAGGAMLVLDTLGELTPSRVVEAGLHILEDAAEALAACCFFWTFVTARFQLRRAAAAVGPGVAHARPTVEATHQLQELRG